ncbi:MAG: VanZ family protein [Coriobacteriaceae bacterium]|nr:VanZ family protein [Coriobacteriaceae bacterium]
MRDFLQQIRERVSIPWLVLTIVFIAVIWGNSLVPGSGSDSLSLGVLEVVRGALRSAGLPFEWLTNFLVRKTAHFCEYAVLGVLASQAFDPHRRLSRGGIVATALLCALVPSIDETIQLFVAGRSGQVTDVLLDCCGAVCGMAARALAVRALRRR